MNKSKYHGRLRQTVKELLEKRLLVVQYNWITKKVSIGVLKFYKCPELWEILIVEKDELILQAFMTASYPYGKATKNWVKNSKYPIIIEDDMVTEILQSSIYNVIEVTD